MAFYHDSRDEACRHPFGAVKRGQTVTIRAASDAPVTLRLWQSEKEILLPMSRDDRGLWEAVVHADEVGLIWYYFIAGGEIYCAPGDLLGGKSVPHQDGTPLNSHQITVYGENFSTPRWLHTSVMYQIFPDRFFDGANGALLKNRNDIAVHADKAEMPYCLPGDTPGIIRTDDFYGGNLPGIEQKLGYLKSLGTDVIYLNPIFKADSNHKYDTGDYLGVDPTFGTNGDFSRLCEKAAAMGMRVILDGVFSHTGADSVYFNKYGKYDSYGACQGKDSPYYPWYSFKSYPDEYDCWWGFKSLPNVNELAPGYTDFILTGKDAVVKTWLRRGASGWRLDVADELPERFIELLRKSVKEENPEAAVIGEVWEDATNKVSYGKLRAYALGRGLDSVMNYPLREALILFFLGKEDSRMLKRRLDSQRENYPMEFYYSLMNVMGTHDRSRILNILGECDDQRIEKAAQREVRMNPAQYALGKARFKQMAELVFALPGMPCIYYGDEAGLTGMSDPFCRAFFPWGREDQELTEHFRRLCAQRHALPVLARGFAEINAPHPDAIEISRFFKDGKDALGEPARGGDLVLRIDRRRLA